jgi:hypothetical protein
VPVANGEPDQRNRPRLVQAGPQDSVRATRTRDSSNRRPGGSLVGDGQGWSRRSCFQVRKRRCSSPLGPRPDADPSASRTNWCVRERSSAWPAQQIDGPLAGPDRQSSHGPIRRRNDVIASPSVVPARRAACPARASSSAGASVHAVAGRRRSRTGVAGRSAVRTGVGSIGRSSCGSARPPAVEVTSRVWPLHRSAGRHAAAHGAGGVGQVRSRSSGAL